MALAELARQALYLALTLSVPVLAASLAAGAAVSLVATALRVQDPALSLLPRQLAVGGVLLVWGGVGASALVRFAASLWSTIPSLVR